jgi:hypothetical protein
MFIINSSMVVFGFNGETRHVDSSHPNFSRIKTLVTEGRLAEADKLASVKTAVAKWMQGQSDLALVGNEVQFRGDTVPHLLGQRILDMIEQELPVDSLVAFLSNLMENPSYRAVEELYGFLEVSKLPITDDGHFLAYKAVRSDYTDIHSGTFDNSVGSVCTMPRNKVDEDKNRTCSAGLHFAAYEYASGFGAGRGSSRMMVLKINPRDVVAIPSDYNNQKGRCCKYIVLREVDYSDNGLTGKSVVSDDASAVPKYLGHTRRVGLFQNGTYIGDKHTFPANRDVEYDLYRDSTDKTYFQFTFVEYNAHGNLVFRGTGREEGRYITVKDLSDWTIELG